MNDCKSSFTHKAITRLNLKNGWDMLELSVIDNKKKNTVSWQHFDINSDRLFSREVVWEGTMQSFLNKHKL